MKDFFENYGLYKRFTLHKEYTPGGNKFIVPTDFVGQTFEYICKKEGAFRTFEIELEQSYEPYYGIMCNLSDDFIVEGKLNHTFKAICKCKSCKEYHIEFQLHVYSSDLITKDLGRISKPPSNVSTLTTPKTKPEIFIEKIGAYPEIKIIPNKLITNYFDRESNKWYYKGINALAQNFGIGALAYFRRIVEKELIHIIESIKLLPDSHDTEIQKLLDKHNEKPKVSTIYDNIFEYLPNSLKILGDNPIKLLYNQTSEGLHSLTESESLEKASKILVLLDFVIKKINEERSEIKDLKEIIKGLK
ncbi:hypothetical protein LCGC14_0068330 [marine sediment metagenome]|uniref:Uncharacterized protein n=1 Tax=marine sediment metagenome TaxID=412755 RepID=A0A0F9W2G1_9ZZZZ|nr:hypothetical protein [Maribacter sp.]HDZ04207.1 hypothetical protein [Maribacter sp.]HEA79186.1 hypothetical protein [Maribacter sp.]